MFGVVFGAADAEPQASSRSLRLCPWTSICLMAPSSTILGSAPPALQPPVEKRDAQHKFLQHEGHAPNEGARLLPVPLREKPFCVAFAPLFAEGNWPFSGTGKPPLSVGNPTISTGSPV